MILPSLEKFPHALVITGNRQVNLGLIQQELEHQDVIIFDQESLKVDVLRDEIITLLNTRKISDQRFVVITTDHFGPEAQNSFLKSLEEPQAGTHIIILISDEKKLLPTILSRAQVIHGKEAVGTSRLDVQEFLKKNLADRFAYIETWTKSKKDEDNVSKTEVIHFIDALEKTLWQEFQSKGSSSYQEEVAEGRRSLFTDIRQMREYANIRGASHRIILDYLAIMLS
jgi:hypothetical protein